MNRSTRLAIGLTGLVLLAGCSTGPANHEGHGSTPAPAGTQAATSDPSASASHDHGGASTSPHEHGTTAADGHAHDHHDTSSPVGIPSEPAPRYPVGTTVMLSADHMPGMQGARAMVVGAYRTITYAVTYTPTTGGPEVVNHKWVVQQELKDAGSARLADGSTVTILAKHMTGMEGATGTVVSSTTQTVYMVDVVMDGQVAKNHKWVVEDEVHPA